MSRHKRTHLSRRGISPVIAAIVLVAVTLVAGMAVGGYISGLFGRFTVNVEVSSATLYGSSSPSLNLVLTNSGSAISVSRLIVAGPGITGTYNMTGITGTNMAVGNGATSFMLSGSSTPAFSLGANTIRTGSTYTLTVTLSNGNSITQSVIAQ